MVVTATKIKSLSGWRGNAALYTLSDPVFYDSQTDKTSFVIVSAVHAYASLGFPRGPQTYIFPANPRGEAVSYLEMQGSLRGTLDHKEAIENAGWVLAEDKAD